jgi:hypothetical protein
VERDLDELAGEITTLAAHVSAAMCRWLRLVAEFDRREGWARWGCKSCAHWLAWRCSLTPATARDHVRVARRLEELPLICAAFARGELSYSKVRALARVTGVEREDELLELARRSTASQLERAVRAYRGVAAVEAGHEGARHARFLDWHHDDDGALVLRGRLPAEEGALLLAALEQARDALFRTDTAREGQRDDEYQVGDAVAPRPDEVQPSPERAVSNADALLALAAPTAPLKPAPVVVHVDLPTLIGTDGGTVGALEDGTPIPAETVRRLCCDAALVPMAEHAGRFTSVGRRTRAVPPAIRRSLERRDRGCRFPGCTQTRHVDAHHIEHWANGGETSVDNLVLLCRHHHRLVHEEGYRLERGRDDRLVFRRPDGRRLRAVPRPRRGDLACLVDRHRRDRLAIGPETSVPDWCGDRLELDGAVQALLAIAPPASPQPVGV